MQGAKLGWVKFQSPKSLEGTALFMVRSDSCISDLLSSEDRNLFYSFLECFLNLRNPHVSLYLLNSPSVISLWHLKLSHRENERGEGRYI